MRFLFREFLKSFIFSPKIRIGFVLDVFPTPYWGKVMASTRLRAYDVINNFENSEKYFLEIYKPWKKYDLVIFQKKFDSKALKLAQKLRKKETKIVLDINVNYFDPEIQEKKYEYMHKGVLKFVSVSDGIITSSLYIFEYAKKLYPEKNIICIEENITDNFFQAKKEVKESGKELKLMYVGYAVKAPEIFHIKEALQELRKTHNFSLLLICEKNPRFAIPGIETEYIKYNQKTLPYDMLQGDIFIAPRDLSNSYNLGHSFTKIGYPLAVGIPVIASRVPSYENSPALLCSGPEEWKTNLEKLLSDKNLRQELGEKGIAYCLENYSSAVIKDQYEKFFSEMDLTNKTQYIGKNI